MRMEFHERLKQLRLEASITQETLADILHVGRATIAGYEVKNKQPDYDKLRIIATYFHVSIDYLIGHSDIKNPSTQAALPTPMSEDKQEVLKLYSALSDRNQGAWVERGRLLLEEQSKKEALYKKDNASKVVSR